MEDNDKIMLKRNQRYITHFAKLFPTQTSSINSKWNSHIRYSRPDWPSCKPRADCCAEHNRCKGCGRTGSRTGSELRRTEAESTPNSGVGLPTHRSFGADHTLPTVGGADRRMESTAVAENGMLLVVGFWVVRRNSFWRDLCYWVDFDWVDLCADLCVN